MMMMMIIHVRAYRNTTDSAKYLRVPNKTTAIPDSIDDSRVRGPRQSQRVGATDPQVPHLRGSFPRRRACGSEQK